MTIKRSNKNPVLILLPVVGTLLFMVLYVMATQLYPGGSQADKNFPGFSWLNNYWCNLLNENAINGEINPARPVAMVGMFILCVTLAAFWFLFSRIIDFRKPVKNAIALSGLAAMTIAMFLFTSYHDIVINIAVVAALVAITGTFVGLYKSKWQRLFIMGLFNLGLIVVNNVLYYSAGLLKYLPVVQKVTFLYFLLWICLIDIQLYKKQRSQEKYKEE